MSKTIDGKKPCVFRCKRGHEFVATANEVMNEGYWCPVCDGVPCIYDKTNEVYIGKRE